MGIGPSTKQTSKYYFNDPLLKVMDSDDEIDLIGVMIVGTPQSNREKQLVAQRAAKNAKAMNIDGALVSSDGWGNSDVDFVETITSISEENIKTVGLKFIGKQAKFVVESPYTKWVLDYNKSAEGKETQVVGENTIEEMDVKKALAMLKLRMR